MLFPIIASHHHHHHYDDDDDGEFDSDGGLLGVIILLLFFAGVFFMFVYCANEGSSEKRIVTVKQLDANGNVISTNTTEEIIKQHQVY